MTKEKAEELKRLKEQDRKWEVLEETIGVPGREIGFYFTFKRHKKIRERIKTIER